MRRPRAAGRALASSVRQTRARVGEFACGGFVCFVFVVFALIVTLPFAARSIDCSAEQATGRDIVAASPAAAPGTKIPACDDVLACPTLRPPVATVARNAPEQFAEHDPGAHPRAE